MGTRYKRAKLKSHDINEKFNAAFNSQPSRRYVHKRKPKRRYWGSRKPNPAFTTIFDIGEPMSEDRVYVCTGDCGFKLTLHAAAGPVQVSIPNGYECPCGGRIVTERRLKVVGTHDL